MKIEAPNKLNIALQDSISVKDALLYSQRTPPLVNNGDVERRKLLISMTSAKVTKLEEALEGNWVAHVVVAGIGFALVYGVANLPKLLSEYFVKGDYDKKGVAAITLAILLFYFMKLGHLLSSYGDVTDLQKVHIDNFHQPMTLPLRKSTSFLADALSDESYQSNSFWPYLLITCGCQWFSLRANRSCRKCRAYKRAGWFSPRC
jgi:hypothetical protein